MIDMATEQLIPITDAPKHIPGRPALMTVYRWMKRGVSGVRLESLRIGGRRFTSMEALSRFFHETTAAADRREVSAEPTHRRSVAIERAERELAEAGI